jgi:hypothetical protein
MTKLLQIIHVGLPPAARCFNEAATASYKHDGYRAFYTYRQCGKYYVEGDTCPTDDTFDAFAGD